MVAFGATIAALVGPGALFVGQEQAAHADRRMGQWRCCQTALDSVYTVRHKKSWRGCPLGTILAFDINMWPPESFDGWDGGCAKSKATQGSTFNHIKSYCRLREFGGSQ